MTQYHYIAGAVVLFLALLALSGRRPRADREFMANRPTLDPKPMPRGR
jgi:hypothetical protein